MTEIKAIDKPKKSKPRRNRRAMPAGMVLRGRVYHADFMKNGRRHSQATLDRPGRGKGNAQRAAQPGGPRRSWNCSTTAIRGRT